MRLHRVLLATFGALGACAAHPSLRPTEFLDEQNGNTLVVAAQPLVFARERSDVAAHAHDYATLVAIEIDHSGGYSDYLLLYRWSTVDSRMSPPPESEAGELCILADGRRIELTPLPAIPVSLARARELHLPRQRNPMTHAYLVDATLLRYIATSSHLSVRMPQEQLDLPFALFEDGRAALDEFAKNASP